ncbi:hypothetical protein MRB53_039529 [Persea americana]|nr:hypothetical protein MRB53_039529 [Persea americana]
MNKRQCNITPEVFASLEEQHHAANPQVDGLGVRGIAIGDGERQRNATWSSLILLELVRYKSLFNGYQMTRMTLLVWLIYICDFWGFTLAGVSLESTYRSYVYIYLPGIAGVLLGVLCYDLPRVGRQITMFVSFALMAVSMFVYTSASSRASGIGLNVMEYFFQSMANAVLYGWTPAYHHSTVNQSKSRSRLFGIIAPIVAQSYFHPVPTLGDYNKTLYIAGGVTLGAAVGVALLSRKRVGAESM